MESFHVNARTDLETFSFCLIYLLWSQYFLGKMQMLFQVRFSAGEGKGREEPLSRSPLYSFPTASTPQTAADKSPVLQPRGRWILRAELPQLLPSRTAEQESRGRLPSAGPTAHACHGELSCQTTGCALTPQKTPGQVGQASPHQGMRRTAAWGDTWLNQTRWQPKHGSWWYCCAWEVVAAT